MAALASDTIGRSTTIARERYVLKEHPPFLRRAHPTVLHRGLPLHFGRHPSRSASVAKVPTVVLYVPTAVHTLVDEHETPKSTEYGDPVGFGVGWMAQVLPSHASARVANGPEFEYETAVH